MSRPTRLAGSRASDLSYAAVTPYGAPFQVLRLSSTFLTLPGGLLPFRSPLLRESRLISFPGLLRWFTSPSVAPPPYFIQVRGAGITPGGLPHSDIRGSQDMCSSPRLFAACRVLHRLSAPGHPPWTCIRLAIWPLHLTFSLLLLAFLPCTFQTSWAPASRPSPFYWDRLELN